VIWILVILEFCELLERVEVKAYFNGFFSDELLRWHWFTRNFRILLAHSLDYNYVYKSIIRFWEYLMRFNQRKTSTIYQVSTSTHVNHSFKGISQHIVNKAFVFHFFTIFSN
jgi:hypothetical protein